MTQQATRRRSRRRAPVADRLGVGPGECIRTKNQCRKKRRYDSTADAEQCIAELRIKHNWPDEPLVYYGCPTCGFLHVGHTPRPVAAPA